MKKYRDFSVSLHYQIETYMDKEDTKRIIAGDETRTLELKKAEKKFETIYLKAVWLVQKTFIQEIRNQN